MPRKFRLSQYASKKRVEISASPKKKKRKLQEKDVNTVSNENHPPVTDSRYSAISSQLQNENSDRPVVQNDIFTYFAYLKERYGTSKISPEHYLVSR